MLERKIRQRSGAYSLVPFLMLSAMQAIHSH